MSDIMTYKLQNEDSIISPSLIFYKDIIEANIQKMIANAGDAERLCPHVKTHKSADVVRIMLSYGIHRFKAATIAEAEMVASSRASDVVISYPVVGPNIERFIRLQKKYPETCFWAIGDNESMAGKLGRASKDAGLESRFLLDVNPGLDRTGVKLDDAVAMFEKFSVLPGLRVLGFHCYDGNHSIHGLAERQTAVDTLESALGAIKAALCAKGFDPLFLVGGTPSSICHAKYPGIHLSPGTSTLGDGKTESRYPELGIVPGAVIFCRVVSRPTPTRFTLDLGYKGIASDPVGARGYIIGYDAKDYEAVMQNEEHWVYEVKNPSFRIPEVGEGLYVVPTHICPSVALYPFALVCVAGQIREEWPITARNRKITI